MAPDPDAAEVAATHREARTRADAQPGAEQAAEQALADTDDAQTAAALRRPARPPSNAPTS